MRIVRSGSARWQGGLRDGRGSISTESGALAERPYGFRSRFEGERGTNPEELLGAAHAACFTMALSKILGDEGLTAARLGTTARVTLEQTGGGYAITAVHLALEAEVPGADESAFRVLAERAKANCPVSKVLNAAITLEARLIRGPIR